MSRASTPLRYAMLSAKRDTVDGDGQNLRLIDPPSCRLVLHSFPRCIDNQLTPQLRPFVHPIGGRRLVSDPLPGRL